MNAMVYVAWTKKNKRPLYIGSSRQGMRRAFNNVEIIKRWKDIRSIDFYPCRNYSEALSLEARLCWQLKPTKDMMVRKPIPWPRRTYQGKISSTVNPFA